MRGGRDGNNRHLAHGTAGTRCSGLALGLREERYPEQCGMRPTAELTRLSLALLCYVVGFPESPTDEPLHAAIYT